MMFRGLALAVPLVLGLPATAQIRNDAAMAIEAVGPVAPVPGPGLDAQSLGVAIGGGLPIQIVTIPQPEKAIALGTPVLIQGDSRRRGLLPFAPSPDLQDVMFEIGQLRITAKPEGGFHRELGGGLSHVTTTMLGTVVEDRGTGPSWKGVQVVLNITCEGEASPPGRARCAVGAKFRSPSRPRTSARNTVLLEVKPGPIRNPGLVPAGNLEAGTHTLVLAAETPVSALPRGLAKDVFMGQPVGAALTPGLSQLVLPVATQSVLIPPVTLQLGSLALGFTSSEVLKLTPTAMGKPGEMSLRLLGSVEADVAQDGDSWKGLPSVVDVTCRQAALAAPLACEMTVTVSTPP
jgi:hypothetical protein